MTRWKAPIGLYILLLLPIILGLVFVPELSVSIVRDFNDNYGREKCLITDKEVGNNSITLSFTYRQTTTWTYRGLIVEYGSESKIRKLDRKYQVNNTYPCWVDWGADYDGVAFKLRQLDPVWWPYILVGCVIASMCIMLVILPTIGIVGITIYSCGRHEYAGIPDGAPGVSSLGV